MLLAVLTTRIPDDLLKAIQEIEREERAERAEVVRRLLDRAVHDWRVARSLRMIQEGRWTIRRGAKFAGLSYHEMLDRMGELGVDSGPPLKKLREGLRDLRAGRVRPYREFMKELRSSHER